MFFTIFVPHVRIETGVENMNKSLSAFVLGLIFSIIGAISAYFFWVIFVLVGTASSETIQTISTIVPLINLISFGFSIAGSIFCLFKKRVGGIILTISSLVSFICYITISISLRTFNAIFIFLLIPTAILLITGLNAIKRKKVQ